MGENGTRTAAQKASVVEGYRSWKGTQRDYASSVGLPLSTVSRWLLGSVAAAAPGATPAVWKTPRMLEVVPTGVTLTAPLARAVCVRLMLGDGVGLLFETLPPASWVAELAAELRRC